MFNASNTKYPLTGLKYLILFHRINGISYLNLNFGNNLPLVKKFILILLNILLFITITSQTYTLIMRLLLLNRKHSQMNGLNKSQLIFILYNIGFVGYLLLTFYAYFLLIIRGTKIVTFLQKQEYVRIEARIERRIGIIVLILQFVLAAIVELIFYIDRLSDITYLYTYFPWEYFKSFTTFNTQLLVFSLMAYQSCCVCVRLREITEKFTNLKELENNFCEILKIQDFIQIFDDFISHYSMFSIIVCTLTCISSFVLYYLDTNRSLILNLGDIIEALIILIILCLFSDIIPKYYDKFLIKLRKLETEYMINRNVCNNYYSIDYSLINRMYYMRDELCFTAFNLYKINTKTFISLMALVLSYSVILIQTNPNN